MSCPACNYEPTTTVETLNGFYHAGSESFAPSSTEYQISMAGFAAVSITVGVLLLLIMWLTNLCMCCKCGRKCCSSCSCCGTNKTRGKILICVGLFIAGIISCSAFYPRQQFQKSVEMAGSTMEKMHALVVKIDDNVDIMLGAFDGVYGFDAKVQQVCSKDQAITDELVEVFGTLKISVQEMKDSWGGIPDQLGKAVDYAGPDGDLHVHLDAVLGGLVGMILLLAFFGSCSVCTECKGDDHLVLLFGSLTLIAMIAGVTALFTASVLVADFCYDDPTQSISALTTNLSPFAESMISYYATCSGQNMLGESQAQAMADLAELKQELEMAKQHPLCEDTELQLMIGNIASKTETPLGDIHMAMQCDTLNEYFAEIVNDNLCDPFVEGMAQLWVMLAASGFVILVMFITFPCVTRLTPDQYATNPNFRDDDHDVRTFAMIGISDGPDHVPSLHSLAGAKKGTKKPAFSFHD